MAGNRHAGFGTIERGVGDTMTIGIERAACIGGGVIGSGWAARFILNGVEVSVFDPDPETGRKVG